MHIRRFAFFFSAGILLLSGLTHSLFADVETLTDGEHTRIVWLEGGDKLSGGGALMGYDSRTNQITKILDAEYRQSRPVICGGGHKVVVTINHKIYIVNWDGTGKAFVADGFCSDVWADPATGQEWVIASMPGDSEYAAKKDAARYLIEDPSQKITLLDRPERLVGTWYADWLQFSADGRYGLDCMPWPNAGILEYAEPAKNPVAGPRLSIGCWPSMASDNSYYWFIFGSEEGHSIFKVYRYREFIKDVPIDAGPRPAGTLQYENYHPRFASKGGRFVVLTAGYTANTSGGEWSEWNPESDKVEVYFGKFSADYTGFEGWARITSNNVLDCFPDAWVGVTGTTPTIELSAAGLSFSAHEGGANPAPQTLAASTPYGTLENLTAVSDKAWLSVTVSGSGNAWSISNSVNSASLPSGTHGASVTVTAPNAVPPSKTYSVTVVVSGTAVPTTIEITPSQSRTVPGVPVQLTARLLDQTNTPIVPQPAFTWSASGPGSVSVADGLFSGATVLGTYTITARYGSISDLAYIELVAEQPINILFPVGGERFAVGTTMTIQWVADGSVAGVVIQLSVDNGDTWQRISPLSIARDNPSWGAFAWNIPPTIISSAGSEIQVVGNTAKIRIYDYFRESVYQETEEPFSIVPESSVLRNAGHSVSHRVTVVAGRLPGVWVTVPWNEPYVVELFGLDGGQIERLHSEGSRGFLVGKDLRPGACLVSVRGAVRSETRRVVIR